MPISPISASSGAAAPVPRGRRRAGARRCFLATTCSSAVSLQASFGEATSSNEAPKQYSRSAVPDAAGRMFDPPPTPMGWCVPDGALLAWCSAARAADPDAAPLPPPWEAHEPAAVPVMGAPPFSSTTLYLASLVPLLVLLYHRLHSRADDAELLPLPLAAAVARLHATPDAAPHPDSAPAPWPSLYAWPCLLTPSLAPRQVASLTPSLMLNPAAGVLASLLLNTMLLVHLVRVRVRVRVWFRVGLTRTRTLTRTLTLSSAREPRRRARTPPWQMPRPSPRS